MKVGIVADVHVANFQRFGGPVVSGTNQRCRQTLAALEMAVVKAKAEGCTKLAILGDLLDSVRPEPQIVARIQEIIDDSGNFEVFVLVGNHEQVSTSDGDHAVGPLWPVSNVIEEPLSLGASRLVFVPFQPGPAIEWLPKALSELVDDTSGGFTKNSLLLLHLGIADADTAEYLKGVHDSIPVDLLRAMCVKYGFAGAMAGNWHKFRNFTKDALKEPLIVQVGALVPTGFRDAGWAEYGKLIVWDTESPHTFEVFNIPGPRFIQTNNIASLVSVEAMAKDVNQVYVRLVVPASKIADAQGWVADAKEKGIIVGASIELDRADAEAASRSAAGVARSAQTLDDALARYVGQITMPDGITREAVLASARKYLGE